MFFSYNPKDKFYTFYHYEHYADGVITRQDKIPFGNFILDLLDLDISDIFNSLPLNVNEYSDESICTSYGFSATLSLLSNKYNHRIIDLILRQLISIYGKYNKEILLSSIADSMISSLKSLQCDLSDYVLTGEKREGWCETLQDSQSISVTFKVDIDGIYAEYEINDIFSLISLDFANIQAHNIPINRCENCHRFFIPSKRSDEIYCDRIFKNGKTCKKLGYSEKVKSDSFKQMYTKARKTQHARIRYNSHIPDYKEKHYEPWKKAAEQARNRFQATNDIDSFEKWINDHKNSF